MGEKMYYIYRVISESNEPIKGQEILQYLEGYGLSLNIKTVYSLIKRINGFYYCLTGKQLIKTIRRSGFVIDDDFFDDGQLQLLMDSIIFNPNLDKQSAIEMVDRLSLLSSFRQLKRLNIENVNNNILNYKLLVNLTTIIKAINNHKNVVFKYVSYDIVDNSLQEIYHTNGNIDNQTYVISPYKLILKGSNYYLIGYFSKRKNSLSVYRVDRMRLVRNHNSKFEDIRDQFDMAKEFDKNVNMYLSSQRIDLKVRFNQSVLKDIVNEFGKDIIVSKTYDGKIEAVIKNVSLSDGLIGWIMMLQDKIEVIFPLSLKELVKTRIKAMLRIYE